MSYISYLSYVCLCMLYKLYELFKLYELCKIEWVGDISEFDDIFIKSYNDENDEEYFFEDDAQYPKKLHDLHNNLPKSRKACGKI